MVAVLIVAMVFTFTLMITKMSIDYNRERTRLKYGSKSDNSMRVSELQQMIKETVEEANTTLQNRIFELEAKMDRIERRALPQGKSPLLLEDDAATQEKPLMTDD